MATTSNKPAAKKPEATKYSVAELVAAGPTAFGVPPEILAGALYGKDAVTKDEAKKLVKEFKAKPVAAERADQDKEKGAAN